MIRRIIGCAFVLVIFAAVNLTLAQEEDNTQWITGEVASIEMGQEESLVSLKMADGEVFNVAAASDLLKDVEVGDVVTVQISKGWAEMVEVAKGDDMATPAPEAKDKGPQWVAGEVVAIQEGDTDSLISVKRPNDSVFNIAIANDKLGDLKVGDQVTVKIQKGWAQSLTEKE